MRRVMVQILERRGCFRGNYTAGAVPVNAARGEKPPFAAGFRPYHDRNRPFRY